MITVRLGRKVEKNKGLLAVNRAARTLERPDEVLDEIHDKLFENIKGRFLNQQYPTGVRWERSEASRRENRATLYKTGELFNSIEQYRTRTGIRSITARAPHGRFLYERWPFLQTGNQDAQDAAEILDRWMSKRL